MTDIKMLLRTATTLALMLLCTFVCAQGEAEQGEQEARTILNEMSAKMKSYANISIAFNATLDNKRTNQKETHSGTLLIKKNRYALDLYNMVTYADDKTVSVWQKENNELDITDADPDADDSIITPSKLFSAYQKGYKLRLLGDRKIGGVMCREIDLYPIGKSSNQATPAATQHSNMVRVRISIDIKTKQIRQIMQQNKNGDYLTVEIKKMDTTTVIADKAMNFDRAAHPEVEIVDLR